MGGYAKGSVWYYAPNKPAPVVFTILFLLSGCVHAWQTFRYKSWRFTGAMPWAALLMAVGFIMREVGAYHFDNLGILIASVVLIMSGPPVYAAINYLILSRMLFYIPYLSPIHPGRVLTTFLAIDGMVEVLIGQGASRMANSSKSDHFREVGASLVKAALIIQAVLFIAFVALAGSFHRKCIRAGVLSRGIKTVLVVMYCSCALITVRCIYRIVEFFDGGWTGSLYIHEEYFWVFEAMLMFINTLILNIWHPGRYLPRSNSTYLDKDGKTERRGPGWSDNRPFLVTFIDPFDLCGLFSGKDKKTAFWDMPPDELEAFVAEVNRKKKERRARRARLLRLGMKPRGAVKKEEVVVQNEVC